MAKTLEQVDREIKDAERRRVETARSCAAHRLARHDRPGPARRNARGSSTRSSGPASAAAGASCSSSASSSSPAWSSTAISTEQQTIAGDDRRMRPDVIVRLPGGKHVVIDAKAPLDAYLRALEAPDEAARQELLADHARQVRTHI